MENKNWAFAGTGGIAVIGLEVEYCATSVYFNATGLLYGGTPTSAPTSASVTPTLSECLILTGIAVISTSTPVWTPGTYSNVDTITATSSNRVLAVDQVTIATPGSATSETGSCSSTRYTSITVAIPPAITYNVSLTDTFATVSDTPHQNLSMTRTLMDTPPVMSDNALRLPMTVPRVGIDIFGPPLSYPGPWLLYDTTGEAAFAVTDAKANAFFSNPALVVFFPINYTTTEPTWPGIVWSRKYSAYTGTSSGFAYDAANGLVNSIATAGQTATVVGYDNENWMYTPTGEWTNNYPIPTLDLITSNMINFCSTAHHLTPPLQAICMPAEDLMDGVSGPGKTYSDKYTAFLMEKDSHNRTIAEAAATICDYYHIQAQELQSNIDGAWPSMVSYVSQILAQIRGVSSTCIVTVGLTGDVTSTAGGILNAIAAMATLGGISGYWLNIVLPNSPQASAALAALDEAVATGNITEIIARPTSSTRSFLDTLPNVTG